MNIPILKYILKVLTISIIVIIIPVTIVCFLKPDKENNLYEWKVKRERYEKLPSPRILFIGDSNLAFGLNSKAISDSLKRNVQNAGLHGGIGLLYEISEYDDLIKDGDIVVICCAYDQYVSGFGEYLTLPVVLFYNDWHGLTNLTFEQWKVFFSGFFQIFKQKYSNAIFSSEREYRASYYNVYGDESKHWEFAPLDSIPPMKFPDEPLNEKTMDVLFGKLEQWEKKGAKVLFMPACISKSYYQSYKEKIEVIADELQRRDHPYMLPIKACVFDEKYMYDGNYHLNKMGVDSFTGMVIEQLKYRMQ